MKGSMTAIINVTIYDFNHFAHNQYILFDSKIKEVGPMSDFSGDVDEVIDGYGYILMPSLVNAHSHIYSTFARGLSLDYDPQNFMDILKQLWWKLDRQLGNECNYASGIVHSIDTVKNGVTTLIDHHASGRDIRGSLSVLKKAVSDEVGLRGIYCFETSDRFDVRECIDENVSFMENNTNQSRGLFGLHASLSLSDDTLMKVKEVIGDCPPIHIHVAESEMDELECEKLHGLRVVERLDKFGLLNKNSLLAHCLYINEEEAQIIKKRDCYVVLNVTSNMNNSVGLPDYELLKKHDIPVLIGNDGISSSITTEWLNLYYTMHHKSKSPTGFSLDDLQRIVQANYDYVSDMFGLQLGRIEEGYEADMLLLPYIAPTPPIAIDNAFGHLFFGMANSFRPRHVWCGGFWLVNDYQVCKVLDYKYKEAAKTSKKLWERLS